MEHAAALAIGFALDFCFGDPAWLPHPVVAMGKAISVLESMLRRLFPQTPAGRRTAGTVLAALLPLATFGLTLCALWLAGLIGPWLRFGLECFWCWQALAARGLCRAGMSVYQKLAAKDLPGARKALSGIVGRDTESLDEPAVIRATVETLAENTADGVVAPMFWFALGGAPLALAYKAVNTMDSMVGYKDDRYIDFGRAAARLDDAANWLPARLTALLMVPAACLGLDFKNAWRIWRRDRKNHQSPNSGQPEAACAGALGIRLGGDAVYFGIPVHKATLGDDTRPPQARDIQKAAWLLWGTAALALAVCCGTAAGMSAVAVFLDG